MERREDFSVLLRRDVIWILIQHTLSTDQNKMSRKAPSARQARRLASSRKATRKELNILAENTVVVSLQIGYDKLENHAMQCNTP